MKIYIVRIRTLMSLYQMHSHIIQSIY